MQSEESNSNKLKLSKEKEIILKDKEHNIKVVAGPGSGKTTLLVEKVTRLINAGVDPKKILLI
ncbi:UvrD-helicase domain-containing protein, partial [Candidatus Micrarchaeota archaeon]|nr:UvrD-helicase domain-containing protein [Candidatus Micrarchaeota archaeon]